jgi:hypothetical protein
MEFKQPLASQQTKFMMKILKLEPYFYIYLLQAKKHERRQPMSLQAPHLFLNIWHPYVPRFSPCSVGRQGALWNHCYSL